MNKVNTNGATKDRESLLDIVLSRLRSNNEDLRHSLDRIECFSEKVICGRVRPEPEPEKNPTDSLQDQLFQALSDYQRLTELAARLAAECEDIA